MLNNKGQSLTLFIVVIPILLLILILVIDIGRVITIKRELSNISDIVLDYGLDHLDEDDLDKKLEELIELNKNDIDNIELIVEEERIYLNFVEKSEGILSGFVNISIFDVKTSYVGYIENNEKRIEKMGD